MKKRTRRVFSAEFKLEADQAMNVGKSTMDK
ncbi:hypothetical protein VHE8714_03597 [Vibrio splendidus]|nr:hypothetical protein VHE8714_03597 [Vibrio splendidus]